MIKRKLYYQIQKLSKGREAIVMTGMRQVGKTTILKQIFDDIESKNKIFIDLENPLYQKYFESEDYEKIIKSLQELGLDMSEKAFLFLDEIQFVKILPSFVKYCIDHYQWKFFLTGSSSFYLKNLFHESLAGRKYLFELYPFDFEEFLELKGIRGRPGKKEEISETSYLTWQKWYEEYVRWGGFPAVIGKNTPAEKKKMLEEIFSSYFNKEVAQWSDFKNNKNVRDLMLLLLARAGGKVDFQKFAGELGISRITVKEYMTFLEGTYFISLVYPFSRNKDVEIRSTPKVYICDSGLVTTLGQIDKGHIFENAIFHQLRSAGTLNYYERKNGGEIDFIMNKKQAFEVKMHASIADLKKYNALAKNLSFKNFKMISYNYTEIPKVMYGFQL